MSGAVPCINVGEKVHRVPEIPSNAYVNFLFFTFTQSYFNEIVYPCYSVICKNISLNQDDSPQRLHTSTSLNLKYVYITNKYIFLSL